MDIKELLKKYLNGECSITEESIAKRWLEVHIADPEYDQLFEELITDTPSSDDADSLKRSWIKLERFMENETEQDKKLKRSKRIFSWINVSVITAAAAVLIFFITPKQTESTEWHEIYVARGETDKITLCDGTSLWISSDTKVIYPSRFDSETRTIFVDGEVYADVTPDKNRPFIISTSRVKIKVHGTEFNIKAFAERQNIEVTLVKGSVTVEDNDNEVFSRTLKPGESIRYNHQYGTIEQYNVDTDTYGSLKNNSNMKFINESLEDIADELERRFDIEILIEDHTLAKTQYYASFINNEGLDKILRALNSDGSMKIYKRNDIIVISPNN